MTGNETKSPLLVVDDLARHHDLPGSRFFQTKPVLKAVDGVSFVVDRGEIFGIVGESGCGKSTLARMIMALETPSRGSVHIAGDALFDLPSAALKKVRRGFQMVFQDPYGSLDPRQTVFRIVAEPLRLESGGLKSGRLSRDMGRQRVSDALEAVGLSASDADKYPHEFSGGQRQRIAIARALITRPALIVADEPVSALDVSIQAQVLNLLLDLRDQFNLAYVLISHDLGVVEQVSDRLAVMYLGRFVETGSTDQVFAAPAHPYTRMLLDAIPKLDPARASGREGRRKRRQLTEPTPPPQHGCAFAPRCPMAADRCLREDPALRQIAPGQMAACHFAEAVQAGRGQSRP